MIIVSIIGEKIWRYNRVEKYLTYQNISDEKHNQALFLEIWELINKNYYDPNFDGIDWKAERETGLLAAKTIKSRANLYNEIIIPRLKNFPVSHLEIIPVFNGESRQKALELGLFGLATDPIGGLELIDIKRGTKKFTIVKNVIPNSPAYYAGIKIGWLVESHEIYNNPNSDYLGFQGSFKPIIIEDYNSEKDIISNIKNQEAKTLRFLAPNFKPNINFEIKDFKGVKYIKFQDFMSPQITDEIINQIKSCPEKGIIFDLRTNFGGDLMELQRLLTPLLPQHSLIMHTKSRSYKRTFHTNFFAKQCKTKVALLIGPSSISAAEIMAQTLQYYKRAILIGRKTNGSIIGARDFQLSDGSLLQIPVLSLFGPDMKSFEGLGVSPDIKILQPESEDNDASLNQALNLLQK
ncbi:MAG: hypothetical protein J0L55_17325 [Caulobacterales bacterium]|nr:hypothetical protein [Caulobacterales bacterium]